MKKKKNRILKRSLKVLAVLLLLFIGVILFIRSQWGQDIIVTKVVNYVSSKTNTEVRIDRLFLTFSGNIFLEGLYLEDKKGDTLVYSKNVEANLPFAPIIWGNGIELKHLEWDGLKANITRKEDTEKFNFSFLVDAFATQDTVATPTESKPLDITIGTVSFSDFDVTYNDDFLGINSHFKLGNLALDIEEINLEKMRFIVDELAIKQTHINYTQTKAFPITEEDTTASLLPYFAINNLSLEAVKANYKSVPDHMLATVHIGTFTVDAPKIDLTHNAFNIDHVALKNSTVYLKTAEQEASKTDSLSVPKTNTTFKWPTYTVQVQKVDFKDNNITVLTGDQKPVVGLFNASAIAITDFKVQANNINYTAGKATVYLHAFSFNEQSGFKLKNAAFKARIDNNSVAVSNLELQTNKSALSGNASLNYTSLQQLIDTPELASINIAIPKLNVAVTDASVFQPELAKNEYFTKVAQKQITGNITAKGTLKALKIPDVTLKWGENTQLIAKGELYTITDPESLLFNFNTIKATTARKDVLNFVSEKDLGISVPKTIALTAMASGSPTNIKGNLELKIPEGTAKLSGTYSNATKIAFTGNLKVDKLQLDKLLKNEELGALSFTMDVAGNGSSINTLNATLDTRFTALDFNNYDFSPLNLSGEITNGKGNIDLNFKDDNLNIETNTQLKLDSIASNIKLKLNLIGADLYALGVTQENVKLGTKLNANFSGNPEDFKLKIDITETIAVYNNEQYRMDTIAVDAKIDTNNTNVLVSSDFLKGNLSSNGSPELVFSAIDKQFKGYFSTQEIDTIVSPIVVDVNFLLKPSPILTDVLFNGVEQLDSITMKANFNAATKNISAQLLMPSAVYNGTAIDSLNVLVKGNATDLNFSVGLKSLVADPILIKETLFTGNLKNNALLLDFSSFDDDKKLVHIASEVTLAKDTVQVHINPSELIFNKKQWTIPQENNITIAEKVFNFKNVKFTQDTQELVISNTIAGSTQEHLGVVFDNFKLQTFLSLLNPDEALASGLVNGSLVVENPFGASGIVADFKINQLKALQNSLGNLSLKAESTSNSKYNFNLSLKDAGIDMDLSGDYAAAENGAKLNLDLDLNKLELKSIESFVEGAITNAKGAISGTVKVSGTTTDPEYKGDFTFNNTQFKVAALNSVFKISNQKLKINNLGLFLDNFEINDNNSDSFTLNGAVKTEELTNPTFDLNLKADAFQVMNSTKEDNELFYGKASMDADITVKGNMSLPIVTGLLRVRKVTDMTFVVPESQLDVEERDGVVIFVNRENPDDILTRKDNEESSSILKGYKVNTVLEIANDAVFNVIIDKKTGDNLRVSGDAALNFGMSSNGNMSLSGRYELKDGHYETILYNLVKRKFTIKPGSTITWQGNPMDADLDVTAIYNVETSASTLMASVTSSEDASVSSKYQQVLPFLVYLNVDGQLLKPELSFDLDMPEEAQGSLSGAVYARVQQLNEQETELNKQVFSLLALNRFFPDTGSDGSGGGTATIARNNVNKVLSGELNAFSDKIFGSSGFELDFDLDSFTDYQGESPQDRTQLNINAKKKLFNNRLIVSAGSAVDVEGSAQEDQGETPIIGNVSLEYLLSEDGRYRLKGFRKNEYQNVIDGQLILTGVALIFNREFNSFSELFNPIKKEEKAKSKEEKKSNKKDANSKSNPKQ
ncbi:translocation/assembly module TamB [Cellulophaga sp. 20_2_10]|uniref:translocation/assembly module TamB domain-containing protein n=1 Tax=Cellulophaga sp. 20_2_10 TaxID=2942476 RepID=UPI00201B208F|nr:translocation/assembly module TamB domain-containing protein [Cellulophaga sp. 20_2_10]MCL5244494.1 translocation/assembly module TamB [Cellulophaga sp. 20_2_10]